MQNVLRVLQYSLKAFSNCPASLKSISREISIEILAKYVSTNYFIIQDQKAKSIDKLSAIGGTMGLLTGFLLISIVETLFFIIKIIASFLQKKLGLEIKL